MQHNVWTSKGNRHGFIGATVNYIDRLWKYVTRHLILKAVVSKHRGVWLAEPLANVLIKHNLVENISECYPFPLHPDCLLIFFCSFYPTTFSARQPTQVLTIKQWLVKCISNSLGIVVPILTTVGIPKPCTSSVFATSWPLW